MWTEAVWPFVGGLAGSLVGGSVSAYVAHRLAVRGKRIDRHNERLTQMLEKMRSALARWDFYCDEEASWNSQSNLDRDLGEALTIFGDKFAEAGIGVWYRQDGPYNGPQLRERMVAEIRRVERLLGYPDPVDLLKEKM